MGQRGVAVKQDPVFPGTAQHLVLIDMIRKHGWTRGAEIGVLRGKTLFKLLDSCQNLTMFGIDQWKHLPESDADGAETYQKFDMDELRHSVLERAKEYRERCTILVGDSVEQADFVADGSLDFVFIDAAHVEDRVRADIAAWAPKVRVGGFITGHDHQWGSVRRALDDLIPGWTEHEEQVWSIEAKA
jgi:hypothetical protein